MLIEFKRDAGSIKTELVKPRRRALLQAAAAGKDDATTIDDLANAGHILVYGATSRSPPGLCVAPYLSTLQILQSSGETAVPEELSMPAFFDIFFARGLEFARWSHWAERPMRIELRKLQGLTFDEMLDYIDFVLRPDPSSAASNADGNDTAGFWFAATEDAGLSVAAYHSDADLARLEAQALIASKQPPRLAIGRPAATSPTTLEKEPPTPQKKPRPPRR